MTQQDNNSKTSLKELTDETLFARYQGGDELAFGEIVQRYQGPIYGMIMKSVYNAATADEVFQDVFAKVIKKRDKFVEAVSFKAWLFTICRNTLIDRARKKNRRPTEQSIFIDEEKPLEINLESKELSQDSASSGAQLAELVEEALKSVPAEQKETFYLKTKGEMTFEEIGEAMNCSVNTAKSRMRYVLQHLREVFRKRGYLK